MISNHGIKRENQVQQVRLCLQNLKVPDINVSLNEDLTEVGWTKKRKSRSFNNIMYQSKKIIKFQQYPVVVQQQRLTQLPKQEKDIQDLQQNHQNTTHLELPPERSDIEFKIEQKISAISKNKVEIIAQKLQIVKKKVIENDVQNKKDILKQFKVNKNKRLIHLQQKLYSKYQIQEFVPKSQKNSEQIINQYIKDHKKQRDLLQVEPRSAKLQPSKLLASLKFKMEQFDANQTKLGFDDNNYIPYTQIQMARKFTPRPHNFHIQTCRSSKSMRPLFSCRQKTQS